MKNSQLIARITGYNEEKGYVYVTDVLTGQKFTVTHDRKSNTENFVQTGMDEKSRRYVPVGSTVVMTGLFQPDKQSQFIVAKWSATLSKHRPEHKLYQLPVKVDKHVKGKVGEKGEFYSLSATVLDPNAISVRSRKEIYEAFQETLSHSPIEGGYQRTVAVRVAYLSGAEYKGSLYEFYVKKGETPQALWTRLTQGNDKETERFSRLLDKAREAIQNTKAIIEVTGGTRLNINSYDDKKTLDKYASLKQFDTQIGDNQVRAFAPAVLAINSKTNKIDKLVLLDKFTDRANEVSGRLLTQASSDLPFSLNEITEAPPQQVNPPSKTAVYPLRIEDKKDAFGKLRNFVVRGDRSYIRDNAQRISNAGLSVPILTQDGTGLIFPNDQRDIVSANLADLLGKSPIYLTQRGEDYFVEGQVDHPLVGESLKKTMDTLQGERVNNSYRVKTADRIGLERTLKPVMSIRLTPEAKTEKTAQATTQSPTARSVKNKKISFADWNLDRFAGNPDAIMNALSSEIGDIAEEAGIDWGETAPNIYISPPGAGPMLFYPKNKTVVPIDTKHEGSVAVVTYSSLMPLQPEEKTEHADSKLVIGIQFQNKKKYKGDGGVTFLSLSHQLAMYNKEVGRGTSYKPRNINSDEFKRQQAEAEAQRQIEQEAKKAAQKVAALEANELAQNEWNSLEVVTDSMGYLIRKGINDVRDNIEIRRGKQTWNKEEKKWNIDAPDGEGENHFVAIRAFAMDGRFAGYQKLLDVKGRSGDKFYNPGIWFSDPETEMKLGTHALVGEDDGVGVVYVAEGFATAASVNIATGRPAYIAFSKDNMKEVVRGLSIKSPKQRIIVCADNDALNEIGNVGVLEAMALSFETGVQYSVPRFDVEESRAGHTDFNDLHSLRGAEAVAQEIGITQKVSNDAVVYLEQRAQILARFVEAGQDESAAKVLEKEARYGSALLRKESDVSESEAGQVLEGIYERVKKPVETPNEDNATVDSSLNEQVVFEKKRSKNGKDYLIVKDMTGGERHDDIVAALTSVSPGMRVIYNEKVGGYVTFLQFKNLLDSKLHQYTGGPAYYLSKPWYGKGSGFVMRGAKNEDIQSRLEALLTPVSVVYSPKEQGYVVPTLSAVPLVETEFKQDLTRTIESNGSVIKENKRVTQPDNLDAMLSEAGQRFDISPIDVQKQLVRFEMVEGYVSSLQERVNFAAFLQYIENSTAGNQTSGRIQTEKAYKQMIKSVANTAVALPQIVSATSEVGYLKDKYQDSGIDAVGREVIENNDYDMSLLARNIERVNTTVDVSRQGTDRVPESKTEAIPASTEIESNVETENTLEIEQALENERVLDTAEREADAPETTAKENESQVNDLQENDLQENVEKPTDVNGSPIQVSLAFDSSETSATTIATEDRILASPVLTEPTESDEPQDAIAPTPALERLLQLKEQVTAFLDAGYLPEEYIEQGLRSESNPYFSSRVENVDTDKIMQDIGQLQTGKIDGWKYGKPRSIRLLVNAIYNEVSAKRYAALESYIDRLLVEHGSLSEKEAYNIIKGKAKRGINKLNPYLVGGDLDEELLAADLEIHSPHNTFRALFLHRRALHEGDLKANEEPDFSDEVTLTDGTQYSITEQRDGALTLYIAAPEENSIGSLDTFYSSRPGSLTAHLLKRSMRDHTLVSPGTVLREGVSPGNESVILRSIPLESTIFSLETGRKNKLTSDVMAAQKMFALSVKHEALDTSVIQSAFQTEETEQDTPPQAITRESQQQVAVSEMTQEAFIQHIEEVVGRPASEKHKHILSRIYESRQKGAPESADEVTFNQLITMMLDAIYSRIDYEDFYLDYFKDADIAKKANPYWDDAKNRLNTRTLKTDIIASGFESIEGLYESFYAAVHGDLSYNDELPRLIQYGVSQSDNGINQHGGLDSLKGLLKPMAQRVSYLAPFSQFMAQDEAIHSLHDILMEDVEDLSKAQVKDRYSRDAFLLLADIHQVRKLPKDVEVDEIVSTIQRVWKVRTDITTMDETAVRMMDKDMLKGFSEALGLPTSGSVDVLANNLIHRVDEMRKISQVRIGQYNYVRQASQYAQDKALPSYVKTELAGFLADTTTDIADLAEHALHKVAWKDAKSSFMQDLASLKQMDEVDRITQANGRYPDGYIVGIDDPRHVSAQTLPFRYNIGEEKLDDVELLLPEEISYHGVLSDDLIALPLPLQRDDLLELGWSAVSDNAVKHSLQGVKSYFDDYPYIALTGVDEENAPVTACMIKNDKGYALVDISHNQSVARTQAMALDDILEEAIRSGYRVTERELDVDALYALLPIEVTNRLILIDSATLTVGQQLNEIVRPDIIIKASAALNVNDMGTEQERVINILNHYKSLVLENARERMVDGAEWQEPQVELAEAIDNLTLTEINPDVDVNEAIKVDISAQDDVFIEPETINTDPPKRPNRDERIAQTSEMAEAASALTNSTDDGDISAVQTQMLDAVEPEVQSQEQSAPLTRESKPSNENEVGYGDWGLVELEDGKQMVGVAYPRADDVRMKSLWYDAASRDYEANQMLVEIDDKTRYGFELSFEEFVSTKSATDMPEVLKQALTQTDGDVSYLSTVNYESLTTLKKLLLPDTAPHVQGRQALEEQLVEEINYYKGLYKDNPPLVSDHSKAQERLNLLSFGELQSTRAQVNTETTLRLAQYQYEKVVDIGARLGYRNDVPRETVVSPGDIKIIDKVKLSGANATRLNDWLSSDTAEAAFVKAQVPEGDLNQYEAEYLANIVVKVSKEGQLSYARAESESGPEYYPSLSMLQALNKTPLYRTGDSVVYEKEGRFEEVVLADDAYAEDTFIYIDKDDLPEAIEIESVDVSVADISKIEDYQTHPIVTRVKEMLQETDEQYIPLEAVQKNLAQACEEMKDTLTARYMGYTLGKAFADERVAEQVLNDTSGELRIDKQGKGLYGDYVVIDGNYISEAQATAAQAVEDYELYQQREIKQDESNDITIGTSIPGAERDTDRAFAGTGIDGTDRTDVQRDPGLQDGVDPLGNEIHGKNNDDRNYAGGGPFRIAEDASGDTRRITHHHPEAELLALSKTDRLNANIAALKTLKTIEERVGRPTEAEATALSLYTGWGSFSEVFNNQNYTFYDKRSEIKGLLSEEEYESLSRSALSAYYTPPPLIEAFWRGARNMGFDGGRVCDPSAGTGAFLGSLPETLRDATRITGNELDGVSAKIGQLLYGTANVRHKGFEKTQYPDNYFAMSASNIPFGEYSVYDTEYAKHNLLIHDYFFVKAIDKTAPGGLVGFITSTGTLDKTNSKARELMYEKADLVAAIRLPGEVFKKYAGTTVSTDIVYMRKRDENEPKGSDTWLNTTSMSIPAHGTGVLREFNVNQYFAEHPEMVVGEMQTRSHQHGRAALYVHHDEAGMYEALDKAISALPENVIGPIARVRKNTSPEAETIIKRSESVPAYARDGSLFVEQGDVFEAVTEFDSAAEEMRMVGVDAKIAKKHQQMVKDAIYVKEVIREHIALQISESDELTFDSSLEKLNEAYDAYYNRHGFLNDKTAKKVLSTDPDFPLLMSVEAPHPTEKNTFEKTDLFFERTIGKVSYPDSAADPKEAALISIAKTGKVSPAEIESLTGQKWTSILKQNPDGFFIDPKTQQWQLADIYLSGHVGEKLALAREVAELEPSYLKNVEALEKCIPEDIPVEDIRVRLGSNWVDTEVYSRFMEYLVTGENKETTNMRTFNVAYNGMDYSVYVSDIQKSRNEGRIEGDYGTKRIDAVALAEAVLNGSKIQVNDRIDDKSVINVEQTAIANDKSVINVEQTAIANDKAEQIGQLFKDWIWNDPERAKALQKGYNERFNRFVETRYDGTHIAYSNLGEKLNGSVFVPRQTQKDALMRYLVEGRLLASHGVGTGKSFELLSIAVEGKRIGKHSKAMLAVPNNVFGQMHRLASAHYPGAKVLALDPKKMDMKKRKELTASIATGNWDIVLVAHSALTKLNAPKDFILEQIREQKAELQSALLLIDGNSGAGRLNNRRVQRKLQGLEKRIESRLKEDSRDNVLYLDELGIDALLVDEFDNFLNMPVKTNMGHVNGVNVSDSQRALNMLFMIRYVQKLNGMGGVVAATGTDIRKSMTDMYTNLYMLAPDILEQVGVKHYDAFMGVFGEVVKSIEANPEGTGYRTNERLAKFNNLPELSHLYRTIADVVTADMAGVERPKATSTQVQSEAGAIYQSFMADIAKRATRYRNGSDKEHWFSIQHDARRAALDMRLINAQLPVDENAKIPSAARNILEIEKTHPGKTQLVFIDGFVNPTKDGFSVFDELTRLLVEGGIPQERIIDSRSVEKEAQKKKFEEGMNTGKYAVAIGTTQRFGVGNNIQTHLIAMHEITPPWNPRDNEQRAGRIERHGNTNEQVFKYMYATKDSFDLFMYETLKRKAQFIHQAKVDPRSAPREFVEMADATYEEMMAIATGNPKIKARLDLASTVDKLERGQRTHLAAQLSSKEAMEEAKVAIVRGNEHAVKYKTVLAEVTGNPLMLFGQEVTSQKRLEEVGKLLNEGLKEGTMKPGVEIGKMGNASLHIDANEVYYILTAVHEGYEMDYFRAKHPSMLVRVIPELSKELEERIENNESWIKENEIKVDNYSKLLGKPFEFEEELVLKRSELAKIDEELIEMANEAAKRKNDHCVAWEVVESHLANRDIESLQQLNRKRDDDLSPGPEA